MIHAMNGIHQPYHDSQNHPGPNDSCLKNLVDRVDASCRNPRTGEFYLKTFLHKTASLNPDFDLSYERLLEQNPQLRPTFGEELGFFVIDRRELSAILGF